MYMQRDTEIAKHAVMYSMNQPYEGFGHLHKDATRATATVLGLHIKREGGGKGCNDYTVANAKHNNVAKVSDHVNSKVVGERMFLGVSSTKPPKKGGVTPKPQWRMMVDEAITGLPRRMRW
jgi:hypothetical protein